MARLFHLTNGDSAAEPLRRSGIGGEVLAWADLLAEGPLPTSATPEEWRRVRVEYLAGNGYTDATTALASYTRWDAALESSRNFDEICLWFEHDLFDQMLLVHHLAWLSTQPWKPARLTLICIDRYPGVPHFRGLGQLAPSQFAALYPTRHDVTGEELAVARQAWTAFTAPDPRHLEAVADADPACMPFLAGAIRRYLAEYPALRSGLSWTERQILDLLAGGPLGAWELFAQVQDREAAVFMGDATFWRTLRELGREPVPLILLPPEDASQVLPSGQVTRTEEAAAVLRGKRDRVALSGIDRWHGGVHLHGRDIPWRWDPEEERIIATPVDPLPANRGGA